MVMCVGSCLKIGGRNIYLFDKLHEWCENNGNVKSQSPVLLKPVKLMLCIISLGIGAGWQASRGTDGSSSSSSTVQQTNSASR